MSLHNWCFSHSTNNFSDLHFDLSPEESITKTLGVLWNSSSDTFCFKVSPSTNHIFTKRDVLSQIARIFNPLGLLGPVISKAKFFMQQLWLLKLEWHEKLPVPVAADDASEKGFGAVTYVSVIKNNGDRRSQLLCSKSRVAPLKTLTIPRFLLNVRSSKNERVSGPLSLKEINQAELWLIKLVQKTEFSNEIKKPPEKFFGRRGKSSKMFSDNGKTFVGANIELKKLHDLVKAPEETLVSYFNDEHIDWNFILPRPPNFGGLWESEIEAVLNSRPPSPLSSDFDDFETLSAGHFLIGRPVTAIVEPQLINVKENRLTRWQRVNWLSQQIWKVWKRNYFNNLQERSKWRFSKNNVEIGTHVLIKNESLPGTKWLTGRILEVFYGNDNKIRVVNLKLPDGKIIKRNVRDICILPIE
ncbi:DUF5641 domain-containing protein [Trichonephila clavipes]|nr:DUF5641 domain-containing protein [Trichonephila clavipes]